MNTMEMTGFLENMDKVLEPSLALTLAGLAITVSIFLTGSVSTLANMVSEIKDRGGVPADWQTERLEAGKRGVKRLIGAFYFLLAAAFEGLSIDQLIDADSMARLMGVEVMLSGTLTGLGLLLFWLGAREVAKLLSDDK